MLHDQIIWGMLPPGALAPGGTALVDETSYYTITCRCALKTLVADGMPAPDPGAREFRTSAPPVERVYLRERFPHVPVLMDLDSI